mmetsp:Transcript_39131/g.124397  ORF Transcript_39131/g.124397 Transcript_39131/m.124397 type:complete len:442 (-) Transcript_39131:784-2109(-)
MAVRRPCGPGSGVPWPWPRDGGLLLRGPPPQRPGPVTDAPRGRDGAGPGHAGVRCGVPPRGLALQARGEAAGPAGLRATAPGVHLSFMECYAVTGRDHIPKRIVAGAAGSCLPGRRRRPEGEPSDGPGRSPAPSPAHCLCLAAFVGNGAVFDVEADPADGKGAVKEGQDLLDFMCAFARMSAKGTAEHAHIASTQDGRQPHGDDARVPAAAAAGRRGARPPGLGLRLRRARRSRRGRRRPLRPLGKRQEQCNEGELQRCAHGPRRRGDVRAAGPGDDTEIAGECVLDAFLAKVVTCVMKTAPGWKIGAKKGKPGPRSETGKAVEAVFVVYKLTPCIELMPTPPQGTSVSACPEVNYGPFRSREVFSKAAFSIFLDNLATCREKAAPDWMLGAKKGKYGPTNEDLIPERIESAATSGDAAGKWLHLTHIGGDCFDCSISQCA